MSVIHSPAADRSLWKVLFIINIDYLSIDEFIGYQIFNKTLLFYLFQLNQQ